MPIQAQAEEVEIQSGAVAQINAQTFTLSARIVDNEGNLVADYLDANALELPTALSTLTLAQQIQIWTEAAARILEFKAGVNL